MAGARTDAIARAAKVNKALLYYYFKDKEALYGAVLDQVFGGLIACVGEVLSRDLPPREKIMAYAGAHFDYVASHPLYPRIVQGEMMGAGRGRATHLERIVKKYFRPLFGRVAEVLREGQASGEFRAVDPLQFVPSMIAIIVFYFTSAPVMRVMSGKDPLSPTSRSRASSGSAGLYFAALFRHTVKAPRSTKVSVRNKFLIILGVIFSISLTYYFLSTPRSNDLILIGTVDANQVIVSPQIEGRLAKLLVDEGTQVKQGDSDRRARSVGIGSGRARCRRHHRQSEIQGR